MFSCFLVWSTELCFGFSIQMHTVVPLNEFWECGMDRSWFIPPHLALTDNQKWEVEAPILLLLVCFLRTWVLEGWMWVFAYLDHKAALWFYLYAYPLQVVGEYRPNRLSAATSKQREHWPTGETYPISIRPMAMVSQ